MSWKDNEEESEYLMLSGIQHFQFCKRQWALIHIEQEWAENIRTIEGKYLHEKADQPFLKETRKDKFITRAMPVQSKKLGLSGICDVVEFVKDNKGIELSNRKGKYLVYPVEYKRGKPKRDKEDIVQLVAQAICLEEMLCTDIETGYLFYHEIRRRVKVDITDALREEVYQIAKEMHLYYERKHTPRVRTGKHCNSCSLKDICLPEMLNRQSVQQYIERMLTE